MKAKIQRVIMIKYKLQIKATKVQFLRPRNVVVQQWRPMAVGNSLYIRVIFSGPKRRKKLLPISFKFMEKTGKKSKKVSQPRRSSK